MSRALAVDLLDQYRRSFWMIQSELDRLTDDQWTSGAPDFFAPAVLAQHLTDCLDFYFTDVAAGEYQWGHRFGGGWWELPVERWPSRPCVGDYVRELEALVEARLGSITDEQLAGPHPFGDESGKTWLGHYVYALRHTMHHLGELAAVSAHLGNDAGAWE